MKPSEIFDFLDIKAPEEPSSKGGLATFKSISIGGLGDIRLKAIRFHEYRFECRDDQYWLRPVYHPGIHEACSQEASVSGPDMLVDLMNLYEKINRPGKSDKAAIDLVAEWCTGNIHPYAQYEISEEMEMAGYCADEENEMEITSDDPMEKLLPRYDPEEPTGHLTAADIQRLEYRAAFLLDDFLWDLQALINTFSTYLAITDLKHNKPETAETLYYVGKRFDGPALFEQFRASNGPIWANDGVMYYFADMFPPLKMKMAYDYDQDTMVLMPVVRSVFDACWYTLSCVTGLVDQAEPGKARHRFIRCAACGKVITAYGRQRYCQDRECQKQRYRNKSQAAYERRKGKVLPNALPNGKA